MFVPSCKCCMLQECFKGRGRSVGGCEELVLNQEVQKSRSYDCVEHAGYVPVFGATYQGDMPF